MSSDVESDHVAEQPVTPRLSSTSDTNPLENPGDTREFSDIQATITGITPVSTDNLPESIEDGLQPGQNLAFITDLEKSSKSYDEYSDCEYDEGEFLGLSSLGSLCHVDGSAAIIDNLRDTKVSNDIPDVETGPGMSNEKLLLVIFAYILCYLSSLITHILRKPLATSKTNIQQDFDVPTYELGYLDTAFLLCYTIGQMLTPVIFPKSHSILLLSIFHFVLAISLLSLYLYNSITWFIIAYGVIGFACAPSWTLVFQDLHYWLPSKHKFSLITLWCCASEIGSIIGTVICVHMQSATSWRSLFVLSGFLNIFACVLLFSFYVDPKSEHNTSSTNSGEGYLSILVRRLDPAYITRANVEKIKRTCKIFCGKPTLTPMENELKLPENPEQNMIDDRKRFITSGINLLGNTDASRPSLSRKVKSFSYKCYNGLVKMLLQYRNLIRRAKYINHTTCAYSFIKITRHSFACWIAYYVNTSLGYSIQDANYATLIYEIGSCFGSIVTEVIYKVTLKKLPFTYSIIWAAASCIVVTSFGASNLDTAGKVYTFIFSIGFLTNAADNFIVTRCIKSICEDVPDYVEKDFSVACGYTFAVSTLASVIHSYISAFIVHLVGWDVFFICLGSTVAIGTGVLGIAVKYEIDKIKATPL